MFESRYSKTLSVILIIVIVAIVGLLGFLGYDYYSKYSGKKNADQMVKEFQSEIDSDNTTEEPSTNDTNENLTLANTEEITPSDSSSTSKKKKINGFTTVGTMKIPEINFNYPILEEVSAKSLETGVIALYPSGDNINMPGNTVVIGHNYRNGLYFSNLKKLSNGSKIYVTDYRGKSVTYEVYNKFTASSTDTSFYARDTGGLAELTLSTCTDASNDQRTILFAKEVK